MLHGRYTKFTTVEPLPQARIYLIDTAGDLDQLVATFPLSLEHPLRRTAPYLHRPSTARGASGRT